MDGQEAGKQRHSSTKECESRRLSQLSAVETDMLVKHVLVGSCSKDI
jgi:hypothetical protein